MKTYWSAFLPLMLLLLAACSKEQFGTAAQSSKSKASPIQSLASQSCSNFTLIKPKVDILYVVDNSESMVYLKGTIKNSIKQTINSISPKFDFRVVTTKLISSNNSDFEVYTNSTDDLFGLPTDQRRVYSPDHLSLFTSTDNGVESGLHRVHNFMSSHTGSLFRQNAYHLIILISNGNDQTVEISGGNAQPKLICADGSQTYSSTCSPQQSVYDQRRNSLVGLRNSLNSQQFRLFSVTSPYGCSKEGWKPSELSYRNMSRYLYSASNASDSSSQDTFDLCNGAVSTIFASVNSAIQQVTLPHVYGYWPITFAENNPNASLADDLKVFKFTQNGGTQELLRNTHWTYFENNGGPLNTKISPLPAGEPVNGRHFIQFQPNSQITYPDCVLIKSKTKKEYFGYYVLSKAPKPETITVKINGTSIPNSTTNGWSYSTAGQPMSINIKVPDPVTNETGLPVIKSGYMIRLNGSANFYESGDNVEVQYIPAAI